MGPGASGLGPPDCLSLPSSSVAQPGPAEDQSLPLAAVLTRFHSRLCMSAFRPVHHAS